MRLLPVQQAGDGKDLRGFDGLREGEVGDDRHEPLGEHGLPGSRGTDHQEVVPSGGGDLQGAFGLFLAADLAEIEGIVAAPAEELREIDMDRRDLRPAAEKLHHLGERVHRDDLDPLHQRRLGGVFPRDDHPPDAEGLRLRRPRKGRRGFPSRRRPAKVRRGGDSRRAERRAARPWAVRIATAMGRSKAVPSFLMSAGARLTVT